MNDWRLSELGLGLLLGLGCYYHLMEVVTSGIKEIFELERQNARMDRKRVDDHIFLMGQKESESSETS